MIELLRALGDRLRGVLAKAPSELARQDPLPRLQTCCRSPRGKDSWQARL